MARQGRRKRQIIASGLRPGPSAGQRMSPPAAPPVQTLDRSPRNTVTKHGGRYGMTVATGSAAGDVFRIRRWDPMEPRPILQRADASRILQGVGGVVARPTAHPGWRPDRVLPGQPALPVRPARRRGRCRAWREPLAVRLARAMQTAGWSSAPGFAILAISRLFTAGFFSDSFKRRHVDVDYYVSMGEYAYGSLSRAEDAFREVFVELSRKFVGYQRRAGGYQRADGDGVQYRCAPPVREVAADRQSSRRPAPHRARHRAEQLSWQAFPSVVTCPPDAPHRLKRTWRIAYTFVIPYSSAVQTYRTRSRVSGV